jgi:hypothetical protein
VVAGGVYNAIDIYRLHPALLIHRYVLPPLNRYVWHTLRDVGKWLPRH